MGNTVFRNSHLEILEDPNFVGKQKLWFLSLLGLVRSEPWPYQCQGASSQPVWSCWTWPLTSVLYSLPPSWSDQWLEEVDDGMVVKLVSSGVCSQTYLSYHLVLSILDLWKMGEMRIFSFCGFSLRKDMVFLLDFYPHLYFLKCGCKFYLIWYVFLRLHLAPLRAYFIFYTRGSLMAVFERP